MSENQPPAKGIVKNPLTVIAVFAGLAEVSATIALPQLEQQVQSIFVWFVMLFPTLLVALFFFTLWSKHHVLYAPSDFSDEDNFMKHWVPSLSRNATDPITFEEIEEGIVDEQAVPRDKASSGSEPEAAKRIDYPQKSEKTIQSYERQHESWQAERLLVARISSELNLSFVRDVALADMQDIRYDAIASGPSGPVIVEVKRVISASAARQVARRELERAALVSLKVPEETLAGGRLIVGIVFAKFIELGEMRMIEAELNKEASSTQLPIKVEFRLYTLEQLQRSSSGREYIS
ncbi:hypothetical protein [Devosia sp. CAU 1758]